MRGSLGIGFLVTGVLALGCTASGGSAPPSTAPATTASPPSSSPSAAGAGIVRDCASAVAGTLPPDWRRRSVVVGPVSLVWLRDAATISAPALGDAARGFVAVKVLVLVKQGHVEHVWVTRSERSDVALLYDPSRFSSDGRYAFGDGSASARFEACLGQTAGWAAATQFNGGLLVRRSVCLHLLVRDEGSAGPPLRVAAPIAREAVCPAPAA